MRHKHPTYHAPMCRRVGTTHKNAGADAAGLDDGVIDSEYGAVESDADWVEGPPCKEVGYLRVQAAVQTGNVRAHVRHCRRLPSSPTPPTLLTPAPSSVLPSCHPLLLSPPLTYKGCHHHWRVQVLLAQQEEG